MTDNRQIFDMTASEIVDELQTRFTKTNGEDFVTDQQLFDLYNILETIMESRKLIGF